MEHRLHPTYPTPAAQPARGLGGYVLPRILERSLHAGELGEYHYGGKGMDRHFFNFIGLDHESLKAEIAKGGGDGELLAWVNANAKLPRQPWEIAAWSDFHAQRTPGSDAETITNFAETVGKFSTTRQDIHTWFDLLDLDDHCTFGGKA
jgi:hypothetical protein